MSRWYQRLRGGGRRTETAKRDPYAESMTGAGKNVPVSYVSEIIREAIYNREDREHQRKMAMWTAVGSNVCFKLARNAWDDGFEFVDDAGKVIEKMMPIQKQLRALNAIHYLTQATIMERMYGHSWLFCGPEQNRTDMIDSGQRRIANLDAFGPENSDVTEYDRHGYPSIVEIKVLKGITKQDGSKGTKEEKIPINIEHLIHFRTRPKPHGRSFEGIPVLDPVWSTMVALERAMHSSDFYLAKIGHGMYMIKTKSGMHADELTRLETAMEKATVSRIAIVKTNKVEDIGFVNASGSPINFPAEIDSRLGIIASGVDIPKTVLLGMSPGDIAGAEVNIKLLYQTLNQIQTSFDYSLRELVKKLGWPDDNYNIRFITRYAHDEEQKSRIEMNKAQTLAIGASWRTINETRELDGYEKRADGDKLKGDFEVALSGFQTPEEADQTHNKEGAN